MQGNNFRECSCFNQLIEVDRFIPNDVGANIEMMVVNILFGMVMPMDVESERKVDSFMRKKHFFADEYRPRVDFGEDVAIFRAGSVVIATDQDFVSAKFGGDVRVTDVAKKDQGILPAYAAVDVSKLLFIWDARGFCGKVFVTEMWVRIDPKSSGFTPVSKAGIEGLNHCYFLLLST